MAVARDFFMFDSFLYCAPSQPLFQPLCPAGLSGSHTLGSRNDDLVAADIHVELFQGPGGRARNILPRQVIAAVVAGAPDHFFVLAILDEKMIWCACHNGRYDLTDRKSTRLNSSH